MADITVQNLTKYYGDRLILNGISFDLQPGEKVALLGGNGAGKTTLFNILTGRIPYDSGVAAVGEGRTLGMIDQIPVVRQGASVDSVLRLAFQEVDALRRRQSALADKMAAGDVSDATLAAYGAISERLEWLGGYNYDYEIDKVCAGLAIPKEQRAQEFALLSGGEKTRVNLARIILEHTDILLLDEPTNHLDMDSVRWLGDYLDAYQGTVLTISHDRYFLDQCCERIIELRDGKCDFYAGSYSYYAEERERRYEQQLARHENELAEVKRLEAVSRKMHEHGTEHLAKRAASIDKRIARMKVTDRPRKAKRLSMTFGDPNYETEEVLKVRDICKTFDGRPVLQNISFNIRNRERVAILGDNGTGKTTLLRILMGELEADSGTVKKGIGLRPAYLPQQISFANERRTLIDTLLYDKDVTVQTARNRLGAFQFSGEDQLKTVATLSGGEKSRLRLCELMYDPLNLLILDEPTNHLDLLSREWIEEAVEGFTGTLLFVSHDRYFVSRFATRVIYLENGTFTDFQGTYDEFLIWRESNPPVQPEQRPEKTAPHPEKQKTRGGGTKNLTKRVAVLEREIAALEAQLSELDTEMQACASDPEKLCELIARREESDALLTEKMEEWESASAALEQA